MKHRIALWDETSQRYYYVEQATGTTQWAIPTGAPLPDANHSHGEASSYGNGYPSHSIQQDYSSYPSQQQTLPQPGESSGYNGSSNSPAYPNQQSYGDQQQHQHQQQQPGMSGEGGPEGERGLGKMLTSLPGGAITTGLIGFAAGKYLGGNKPSHHQSSGGFGAVGNFFQHQQQQHGGYGNYGPPPPHAQGGFPGYYPPPPSNYGGGHVKPPKKFGFF